VLDAELFPDIPPGELLAELAARRHFIDGVVISGGEPTLDPGLPELLRRIKDLGLQIKLDTNGLAPMVLAPLLAAGLVDYLALDLKTAPGRYGELHPAPVPRGALERSVALLLASGIDYEFRTTCVPGLVEAADIRELGALVRGGRRWILQQFVPQHALDQNLHEVAPHPEAALQALAAVAGEFVGEVGIRGI
jgi:pyruvate formate lyase activating enzyme